MSFKELRRIQGLQSKLTTYQAWLAETPQAKHQAYVAIAKADRAGAVRGDGYIEPFNTTGTGVIAIANSRCLAASQTGATGSAVATALATALNGHYSLTAPTGATILTVKKFKYAICKFRSSVKGTSTSVSRITGTSYKKPTVIGISSAFGRSSTDTTYEAAVTTITTAAETWATTAADSESRYFYFTPEG